MVGKTRQKKFVIFQEKDKNQSGTIHLDHIVEIFRMYEVMSKEYNSKFKCILLQVNLEQSAVQKLSDERGLVTKADFIKLAGLWRSHGG